MYQVVIDMLSSDDYYKVKKDIDKLINDSSFLQEIVRVHNPFVFDRFIKMCEYKIDTSVLCEERNKFIEKSLLSINKDNWYNFFTLNDFDESSKKNFIDRYLTEYIVFYYFQDNYYNFMTNLYQMTGYLCSNKKELINLDHVRLYEKIVEMKNYSVEDKIAFFKEHINDNLMELFYDDMSIVRTDSHKELVNKSLKLARWNSIYQKDVSERLKVDVYQLNGEKFYAFVRCLSIPRGNYLFNHFDYVNSEGRRLGYSFSYIGDKNIGTIDYDGKYTTLFYDNIDYNNIMYVHHGDLHAKKMTKQNDYLSTKENEILTPSSLIGYTNNYNEIYIKNSGKRIVPKALVCYDEITKDDVGFAKKYNLSILVINRDKYKRYETQEDDYDSYSYVI